MCPLAQIQENRTIRCVLVHDHVLLRQGLDQSPPQTYFVHEEEVPRAGARLTQFFERTRWTGGQVYTWLRVRKQTGRGEASSGLGFDEIINVPLNQG